MTDTSTDTDVLVVGAGPTGLLLAAELSRAGVTTTLVERRDTESNLTRAFAVHARTLELLDARGMARELVATGVTVDTVGSLPQFGHAEIDLTRLPSRFPYVLVTPQYETERLLRAHGEALGVDLRWGTELVSLRRHPDTVEAELRRGDGTTYTVRASYLVGTDGVHSTVRRELGLPFPGRSSVMESVALADVRLAERPERALTGSATRDGFVFIAPFKDGWYRVITWYRHRQLPDDTTPTLDEVREDTRRVLGTDHGMHDARWLSRFDNDERQVPHYRQGRVLLAGDAAHTHSPIGGQGMNIGLQDAVNLGWKLAATVRGRADDALLDSYEAERHPVGRRVVRGTGALTRIILLRSRPMRALRALVGGAALRLGPVVDRMTSQLSGIGLRYPAGPGAHPSAGARAPDLPLSGDTTPNRLYEALRTGGFVLLVTEPAKAYAREQEVYEVDVHGVAEERAAAVPPAILVRPDGYIAWATDEPDPDSRRRALAAALEHWCGRRVPQATTSAR
ncbi:FAD-dependent monooxygenase [Streptomyces sp. TRM68416]|uniref:FAD-dependent monooxygenase n=1 Tax=Streptomyces sp. TRM68416 TaxID=2758412 RepID=UPI001662069F|nr:FAD-dependent monooxygenase [Streptomyces sp. TRM68416]MBD0841427.1 FAD-dependent monooxygenase [Streptomyces sp. TRM68416]